MRAAIAFVFCALIAAPGVKGQPALPPGVELPPDTRPRLLLENPRREANEPLVNFNRLEDWAIRRVGVDARFERSSERQLWGRYTGKLSLSGGGAGTSVALRPPAPLPVEKLFNRVSVWTCFADGEVGRGGGRLRILFDDGEGRPFEAVLPIQGLRGWQLQSVEVSAPRREGLRFLSMAFEGFGRPGESTTLFVDSLAMYTEKRRRVRLDQQPARPLDLLAGQLPGRNRSRTETLRFPASRSGATPVESPVLNPEYSARRHEGDSEVAYTLEAKTSLGTTTYTVDLSRGIAGISIAWNGIALGPILRDARILGVEGPLRPLSVQLTERRLRALYQNGMRLDIHLRAFGLEVEIAVQGGRSEGLVLGTVSDSSMALEMPFWRLRSGESQSVFLHQAGAEALLLAAYLDPFLSNATRMEEDRVRYEPLMNGPRNDLFERIIIRLSPRLSDLLPGPSAAPAPRRIELAPTVFFQGANPPHAHLSGIPQLALLANTMWREAQGITALRVAPTVGGDVLRRQFRDARARGILLGVPVELNRIHPLQPDWNEDVLSRDASGAWVGRGQGTYLTKSFILPRFAEKIGGDLNRAMAPSALHVIGLAKDAEPDGVDMDERLRGNGTFNQDWFDRGQALLDLRQAAGCPLIAPAGHEWRFAGLVDGLWMSEPLPAAPYRPLFVRNRIVTNTVVYAPSPIDLPAWSAAVLAYGFNPTVPDHLERREALRLGYGLRSIQERCAHIPITSMAYHDGRGGFHPTAKAWRDGLLQRNQLRLRLEDGTLIHVNGNEQWPWSIKDSEGTQITLPPFGWLVRGKDIFAVRGLSNGQLYDVFESPGLRFFDPRGAPLRVHGLQGPGTFVTIGGQRIDL